MTSSQASAALVPNNDDYDDTDFDVSPTEVNGETTQTQHETSSDGDERENYRPSQLVNRKAAEASTRKRASSTLHDRPLSQLSQSTGSQHERRSSATKRRKQHTSDNDPAM